MQDETSREDSAPAGWRGVTLARILRPRGVRGEVACEILTDFPERLKSLREVWLADAGAEDARGATAATVGAAHEPRRIGVRRCWISTSRGGQAIFHFEGINSINDARPLVGRLVQVPLAQRVQLAAGNYFVTDLIGCEVWEVEEVKEEEEVEDKRNKAEREKVPTPHVRHSESSTSSTSFPSSTSSPLGRVRDVALETGTPLLIVTTAAGAELLIPLAQEICTRIDPAARRIEVRLPPGLRELNA